MKLKNNLHLKYILLFWIAFPSYGVPFRCIKPLTEATVVSAHSSKKLSFENALQLALSFIESPSDRTKAIETFNAIGVSKDIQGFSVFENWGTSARGRVEARGYLNLALRQTAGRLLGTNRSPHIIRWRPVAYPQDSESSLKISLLAVQTLFASEAMNYVTWVNFPFLSRIHAEKALKKTAAECVEWQYLIFRGWRIAYGENSITPLPQLKDRERSPLLEVAQAFFMRGRWTQPLFSRVSLVRDWIPELDHADSSQRSQKIATLVNKALERPYAIDYYTQGFKAFLIYSTLTSASYLGQHDVQIAFEGPPPVLFVIPQATMTELEVSKALERYRSNEQTLQQQALEEIDNELNAPRSTKLSKEEIELLKALREVLNQGHEGLKQE